MQLYNIILTFLILIISIISNSHVKAQSSSNNCSKIFRGLRRSGVSLTGRLEIPVDDAFPKMQLKLKFSRAIYQLSVRQLRARNIGSRREFLIDPEELKKDGIIKLSTYLRLPQMFSPNPRLIGAVYNGKLLCGDDIFEDAVVVNLNTSTVRTVPILKVTTSKTSKDQDEDEEGFRLLEY